MTRKGSVSSFDAHRGLGTVVDREGQEWPFHCVSIADGSRHIEVGTAVEFEVEFKVSRDEAVNIVPAGLTRPGSAASPR